MAGDGERGVALLEVLVALTLVATAGLATISILTAALQDARRIERAESRQSSANRVLLNYELLSRRELDQRIGEQQVDGLFIRVSRPSAELYRLAIGELTTPTYEMLVTVLFRAKEQP